MKKSIFLGVLIPSLFIQCSKSDVLLPLDSHCERIDNHNFIDTKTVSCNELLFHESTGYLIQAKEDPFAAREGDSITHRAVEFYPKDLEEYLYLTSLPEDVMIDFFPFGFIPIREIDEEESREFDSYPQSNHHIISHYTLDSHDSESFSCLKGSLPEDSILPVIYATWPVNREIPETIEHLVRYNISLPSKTNHEGNSKYGPIGQIILPLKIKNYDSFLGSNIPMGRMKVRLSYGSFHCDVYTNSNGLVNISPLMFAYDLSLSDIESMLVAVVYQSFYFTVSRNTAITPIQKVLGTVLSMWGTMTLSTTYPTYTTHQSSATNECEIFRASEYYFNGDHDFANLTSVSEQGRIVHASTETTGYAVTYFYSNNVPTIYVYDNYSTPNDCIGSVLHEFGHVHHYYSRGGYSQFLLVDDLICESFASYVGWSIGENYYVSKGFVKPYNSYAINWQNRQGWTPSSGSNYSPLFVDLTDDYDQYALTDNITGVPASIIDAMVTSATNASQCKAYMSSYIGTYLSYADWNTYFNYYL